VGVCNRFADERSTLFGRAGQEAPEFGDRLCNPGDLAKNQIAVERSDFENFSEKVNQFNAVSSGSPALRPQSMQANSQYPTPQKIEGEGNFKFRSRKYNMKQTFDVTFLEIDPITQVSRRGTFFMR
jgi:hypothetical protein